MNGVKFVRIEARTIGFGIMALIALAYILFLPPPAQITNAHVGMIMLGVIVGAILMGFPIAFTLIGVGILVYVIRAWGGYPDGVAFAVLLMNLAAPTIDYYTRPRTYGHAKAERGLKLGE